MSTASPDVTPRGTGPGQALWVEAAGIEVTTTSGVLPPLSPAAGEVLEELRRSPGGMWDGPAWALDSVRWHSRGIEAVGSACSYFELQARRRAGEARAVWATLVALTADDRLVLTRRSAEVAVDPGRWTLTGAEGAEPLVDETSAGPWDPLSAAARVATEELGTQVVGTQAGGSHVGADVAPGGPAAVCVHLGPAGLAVYVAARLACSAAELPRLAAGAADAWERSELRCVDPRDPSSWPPLDTVHRAACHAAVRRLATGAGRAA